jgi:hypothetical protein
MAAAVTAAAVSAATTVEAATARCAAAVESAANCAVSVEATTATVEAASAPARASRVAWASVEAAAEPRAGTDEQAAGEVARTVVSVWRAGVWVIPIVAVLAYRSWTNVARSDAHAYHNALGAGVRREGQGSSKYRKDH